MAGGGAKDARKRKKREEKRRKDREQNEMAHRAMVRLGCSFYARPAISEDGEDGGGEGEGGGGVGAVSFGKVPPFDELVGTYDVFYFCNVAGTQRFDRTIRGSLVLERERVSSSLRGALTMHPDAKRIIPAKFMNDFSFVTEERCRKEGGMRMNIGPSDRVGPSLPFTVVEFPSDEINDMTTRYNLGRPRGQIRILGKGGATCRMSRDSHVSKPTEDFEVCAFDSIEEARELNRRAVVEAARERERRDSWIARCLGLPLQVALKVHDFIVPWQPPPPALFFERGDLWLNVEWFYGDKGWIHCTLVAHPH